MELGPEPAGLVSRRQPCGGSKRAPFVSQKPTLLGCPCKPPQPEAKTLGSIIQDNYSVKHNNSHFEDKEIEIVMEVSTVVTFLGM